MTEARPPGWYDEPGDDRASLRWWDGRSWTNVTRARSEFEQLPPRPVSTDLLDSGPHRAPGSRRGWIIAGVAALVVLVLVVAGVPGRQRTGDLADSDRIPGPGTVLPSDPAPTTARPVAGRINDRVARLSYAVLPGDWREWDRDSFLGLQSTLGYYRVTQENAPREQTYWANVNSGPLAEDIGRPRPGPGRGGPAADRQVRPSVLPRAQPGRPRPAADDRRRAAGVR